jgi:hypothetical protein
VRYVAGWLRNKPQAEPTKNEYKKELCFKVVPQIPVGPPHLMLLLAIQLQILKTVSLKAESHLCSEKLLG